MICKSETENWEPGTWNFVASSFLLAMTLELGTRNLEPGTWNFDPGSLNLEPIN